MATYAKRHAKTLAARQANPTPPPTQQPARAVGDIDQGGSGRIGPTPQMTSEEARAALRALGVTLRGLG